MIGTLFVVVCALAIAIIGCEVADPIDGLARNLRSERQG